MFDELEEMEQAAALLEVQDEGELDQFLGGLFDKIKSKLNAFVPPELQKGHQEFEVARRVVGLGVEAAKAAAQAPVGGNGGAGPSAERALMLAAQTHARGLAQAAARAESGSARHPSWADDRGRRRGRWFRRGNRIVLVGV